MRCESALANLASCDRAERLCECSQRKLVVSFSLRPVWKHVFFPCSLSEQSLKGSVRLFSLAHAKTHTQWLSDLCVPFVSLWIYLNISLLCWHVGALSPVPRLILSDGWQGALHSQVILSVTLLDILVFYPFCFVCFVWGRLYDLCQDKDVKEAPLMRCTCTLLSTAVHHTSSLVLLSEPIDTNPL